MSQILTCVRLVFMIAMVETLSACATPARPGHLVPESKILPSQRLDSPLLYSAIKSKTGWTGYGYNYRRGNGDEFSIGVLGNQWTSKACVAQIALLRASLLTKEERRTHFVIIIIKEKAETTEKAVLISIPLFGGGVLVPVPVGEVGEKTTKEPMAILLIRLLPFQPAYQPDAFNAAEVLEDLAKHWE